MRKHRGTLAIFVFIAALLGLSPSVGKTADAHQGEALTTWTSSVQLHTPWPNLSVTPSKESEWQILAYQHPAKPSAPAPVVPVVSVTSSPAPSPPSAPDPSVSPTNTGLTSHLITT